MREESRIGGVMANTSEDRLQSAVNGTESR